MENLELNDYLEGKKLYRIGEYEKALKYFEKLFKKYPNNPDYLYALGSSNLYLWDVENALNYYEKCLKVDPSHIKSFIGKISCLEYLDKPEEALELIESYQLENNNELVAARKAVTLMYLNYDKEEVLNSFKNLTIKEPYIYYLKAFTSGYYLDWDNQLKNLNKALEYSDKYKTRLDEGVYINQRDIYISKIDYYDNFDEYDHALDICQILLNDNSNDLEVLYRKARIYYDKSNFKTSMNILNSALNLDPENINLLTLKAAIKNNQGDKKAALSIYEKINEINDQHEYSWGNMAVIYYYKQEYEKSFQHAKKAFEINPDFGFAIFYASKALKKLGKKQLSLDWERKLNDPNVDMIYLEKNLQERLVNEPWRFETIGLKLNFKEREYTLKDRSGRLDILYEDESTGDYVVVELKITKANVDAYNQISDYVDSIEKTIGRNRNVRGILVSFGEDEDCKKLIDNDPKIINVDYRKLGLE